MYIFMYTTLIDNKKYSNHFIYMYQILSFIKNGIILPQINTIIYTKKLIKGEVIKRVDFIRTLAINLDVLLLDEPF